jgi:hypothetical protein
MIHLTQAQIEEALPRVEDGLRKYCWIQEHVHQCDVSRDPHFQKRYNGFYKVRRGAMWQEAYYGIMERLKHRQASFATVLQMLRKETDRVEASFASKLCATLDPEKPVVDRYVLGHFGLRLPYSCAANRAARIAGLYDDLCHSYYLFMQTPVADQMCARFSETFPCADITDLKKVDLILWQVRE